jgi:hypothetical protein
MIALRKRAAPAWGCLEALFLGALAIACASKDPGATGQACNIHSTLECVSESACVNGTCRLKCSTNADCTEGTCQLFTGGILGRVTVCTTESLAGGSADAAPPVQCTANQEARSADCAGNSCVCQNKCKAASDCSTGCCSASSFCAPACACALEQQRSADVRWGCACQQGFCPTTTCGGTCGWGSASYCTPAEGACNAGSSGGGGIHGGGFCAGGCVNTPPPQANNSCAGTDLQCEDPGRHCCPQGFGAWENGICYRTMEDGCNANGEQCPYSCHV